MILVVDGYNLLKSVLDREFTQEQKEQYIKKLQRYCAKKKHKMVIFFDGGFFDMPSRDKEGNITVVYVGRNKLADEAIMDYLEAHKTKDILVVSSDHEITNFAQRIGIVALDSIVFDNYVHQALEKKETRSISSGKDIYKFEHGQENAQLDQLMVEGSEVIQEKPEEEEREMLSEHKQQKLSKGERRRLAQLKKL